jgi:hypothetical protein
LYTLIGTTVMLNSFWHRALLILSVDLAHCGNIILLLFTRTRKFYTAN